MRFVRSAFMGVIAASLLAGASGAALALEKVQIGLAVAGQVNNTPVFAARDLGYFKELGLEVEVTEYNGGAAAQTALSAGAADIISFYPGGVALSISKGVQQKLVGSIQPGGAGWLLMVSPNSPYQTLKDLAGKNIGVTTKGATSDAMALLVAERANIPIRTIPVGGGGLIPGLKSGQLDAIAAFPPVSLQLLGTKQARALFDFNKDMPPMLLEAWVASQNIIDKRPAVLKSALAAIYKGVKYLQENKSEAKVIIRKYAQIDDELVLDLIYENTTKTLSKDGAIDPSAVAASVDVSAKGWGQPDLTKIPTSELIAAQFLPQVPK